MNYYERALELKDETIANRRHIHKNAETGLDLPKTKAYVMEKLTEYGLEPKDCGYGVTATLGKGGKVLLLRADMDALPMPEESGEEFACPTGKEAHTCGHDFHAAMLLTAAKMLKEKEDTLEGTIKFMFQPAEETFEGSKNMIENGILENPPVDAALAMIKCAKPAKKKVAIGLVASAAICAFICGVTEPFEFGFMFLAPGLYVIYALLYGIFTMITVALGFRAGFSFSAGAMDLLFSSSLPAAQKTWLILPLGIAALSYSMLYSFLPSRNLI